MKWFAIIMLILVLWHMNERVTCLEHGHVCEATKMSNEKIIQALKRAVIAAQKIDAPIYDDLLGALRLSAPVTSDQPVAKVLLDLAGWFDAMSPSQGVCYTTPDGINVAAVLREAAEELAVEVGHGAAVTGSCSSEPDDGLTRPPASLRSCEGYHWLHAERSMSAVVSQWINARWYSAGERDPITPQEMRRRGWEYLGPCTAYSKYIDA